MTSKRTRHLRTLADRVLAREKLAGSESWDDLRDVVDQRTGGELDPVQLDIVTDIVERLRDQRAIKSEAAA